MATRIGEGIEIPDKDEFKPSRAFIREAMRDARREDRENGVGRRRFALTILWVGLIGYIAALCLIAFCIYNEDGWTYMVFLLIGPSLTVAVLMYAWYDYFDILQYLVGGACLVWLALWFFGFDTAYLYVAGIAISVIFPYLTFRGIERYAREA
jgi:hypothetical protein